MKKRIWLYALLMMSAPVFGGDYVFSGLSADDLTPLASENLCIVPDSQLTLVENGVAKLPIVFADDHRAQLAAGYLAIVLNEMSGAEFEQFRLPEGSSNRFENCIFIPRPDAGDEFAVTVSKHGVKFSGRSDYAAYDFCERVLGVRQYWDGPSGRSVLKGNSIVIPHLDYHDAPVFSFREHSSGGNPEWLRVAKSGGTFDRATRCHTTDDGFCYGSPEGFAEYCRRVDADIAGGERFVRVADRDRKQVSISPWDVEYACNCKWCRTLKSNLRDPLGEATPILWERFLPRFVKYMAKHHPDYRVNVLPYWNYVEPPMDGTDLGTNVQAEVCSMSGLAAFKWEAVREFEERNILDWERMTGRKVANWHYSCWPAEFTPAPYVYGRTIAAHYRRMRDHVVGSFICGGKDDFPRFSISLYVWMRCLWNPEVRVEAIYDEFCRRQFGAAAKPMREVLEIQERDWDPRTLNFPRKSLERLSQLMETSAELVRGTSAAAAFRYYNSGFSGVFDRK